MNLDLDGNFVWAKKVGGSRNDAANCISKDGTGNLYISGRFEATVDFDPGSGIYNLSSYAIGDTDFFVLKLDSLGNFIWARKLGGIGTQSVIYTEVDSIGNVYGTGELSGTIDFDPGVGNFNLTNSSTSTGPNLFIFKLDSGGNFSWAKKIGVAGNLVSGRGLSISNSGRMYLVGQFYSTVDFDPDSISVDNLVSVGSADIFISEFDVNGNYFWTKSIGGPQGEFCDAITYGSSGSIFITGGCNSTTDFDLNSGGICNLISSSGSTFVAKYFWSGVLGKVFNDLNQNCIMNVYELGLGGNSAIIDPGNIVVHNNNNGIGFIGDLEVGNYSITYDVKKLV